MTVNKYHVLRKGFWENMAEAEGKKNVVGNEIRDAMGEPMENHVDDGRTLAYILSKEG